MTRYIFTLFALVLLNTGEVSLAQDDKPEMAGPGAVVISVSPASLTLDISGRPEEGEIVAVNMGEETISLNTVVRNYDLDEKNNLRLITSDQQSMDLWTVVSPPNFKLKPGQSLGLKVFIKPKNRPQPGEHRAIILFTTARGKAGLAKDTPEFLASVTLFGLAGTVDRKGEVLDMSLFPAEEGLRLTTKIQSTGAGHVMMEGQYTVWRKKDFKTGGEPVLYTLTGEGGNLPNEVISAGELPEVPVLAGSARDIHQTITLPENPGEYLVYVLGSLGEEGFSRTLPFRVEKQGDPQEK